MNRDFRGEMVYKWWIFQPATFNKTPGHASGTHQLWHSRHQKHLIAGFELGDFHWKMIVQFTNGGFSSRFYSQRVAHTLYIYNYIYRERVYIYIHHYNPMFGWQIHIFSLKQASDTWIPKEFRSQKPETTEVKPHYYDEKSRDTYLGSYAIFEADSLGSGSGFSRFF